MATTVDTLLVRIEADLSDVRRGLKNIEKQTQQTQQRVSNSMGKMGTAIKGALGVAAVGIIGRIIAQNVRLASSVEEMQAKSSVVFGQFVGDVRKDLEAFGNAVGRSTFELEGMASSVQDTFVPLGFARGEAAQLSTQLTKLAVDVASFNNASDTQTMQAFQSALVGNHEAVRRFGIVITEAELQAELFRMGIRQNAADVDAQTKVQARLNLILAGTTDAHGDAARTADSFANQSKALGAALEELTVTVLTPLLPKLADIMGGFTKAANAITNFLGQFDAFRSVDLTSVTAIKEEIALLEGKIQELQETSANAVEDFSGLSDTFDSPAQTQIAEYRSQIEELQNALKKLEEAQKKNIDAGDENKDKTKEQRKNEENVAKALRDQRFATEQARQAMLGMSEAHLIANQAMSNLKNVSDEEAQSLLNLIQKEQQYTRILNERKEAQEKEAAIKQSGIDAIAAMQKENEILNLQTMNLTEAERAYHEQLINMGEVLPEHAAKLKILHDEQAKIQAKVDASKRSTDAYNRSIEIGTEYAKQFGMEEQILLETQQALNDALAAGKINADEFAEAQNMLSLELKRLDPMFKSVEQAAQRAGDAIADSLAEAVVEGKLSMDTFQNIFKQFVKELIAEAIKTFIIKKILSMFTGGFGGGGSVGPSSSSFGGDSFMAFAGGGKIPARATGGPVLVGERGPELFIPHSAGSIKNKQDTKNMIQAGGAPVNVYQTIQVETGVSQTVKTEMMNMLPRFKAETMQAVIDGKRRGKAISKVFA